MPTYRRCRGGFSSDQAFSGYGDHLQWFWASIVGGLSANGSRHLGKIHYGWARLSFQVQNFSITATLTGYAYETIPNKPIIAGETTGQDVAIIRPAGLGDLARGVSAFPALRVEQAAATIH